MSVLIKVDIKKWFIGISHNKKPKLYIKENKVKRMNLKNAVKHFKLITKHKWVVFKLCCMAGIPWRGLMHDLSKYFPTEFLESIKYYQGTHSPIVEAKKDKGYSEAWLHHKGRNKHHSEYWIDLDAPEKAPIMPYKYVAEMLCDKLAAGIVYEGKKWTKEYELQYWNKEKEKILINEKVKNLVTDFLEQVSQEGIKKVLNKKNLSYYSQP